MRFSRSRKLAEMAITPGPGKPKIAIVDDDATLRAKIASALRSDFEVLEGGDYDAAVKLLEERELDVLLLGLPIASGGVR